MTEDRPGVPCDGRHPLIRNDGSMLYLYDLVVHPDCPHQPWARPEPERYEAAARGLRANLHAMIDAEMPQSSHLKTAIASMADHLADTVERPSPLLEMIRNRPDLRPSGNGHCYEASWGWVHSRPSCRCTR